MMSVKIFGLKNNASVSYGYNSVQRFLRGGGGHSFMRNLSNGHNSGSKSNIQTEKNLTVGIEKRRAKYFIFNHTVYFFNLGGF